MGPLSLPGSSLLTCRRCSSPSRVEEVAAPYFRWREAGYEVTVASLKGGEIPFDPASKSGDFLTPTADAFLKDSAAAKSVVVAGARRCSTPSRS